MARIKMGVVGCGGRMGRMLVAEIAASEGCAIAGGSEAPGSGYINQDIGELAGIGRMGIPIGETVEKLIRDSDACSNSPRLAPPSSTPHSPPSSAKQW